MDLGVDVNRSLDLAESYVRGSVAGSQQEELFVKTYIETREDCSKRCDTMSVSRPHAAKKSCVICRQPLLYC